MIQIKPSRGYVLIEPEEAETQTASGLLLPETAKDKPQKGIVIEVGGMSLEWTKAFINDPLVGLPVEVDKGNKVYYKKWTNESIKVEGKEYLFVKFEDVLAVIED